MICDACNKNEATVRLVAIVDGVKTERHLCTECVEKQKQQMRADGMQSMLSAIISRARRGIDHSSLRCPSCGTTYETFRKKSRLGCAQCYRTFRIQLKPLLVRLHGRSEHEGRMPERVEEPLKIKNRLERLQREMQVAVACEDFEQAAHLRDELRAITASAPGGEADA